MNQVSNKEFATLVKQARASKNITQQELSDLTGLSLRSVQRIENEEVSPRAYTVRLLIEKLGIDQTLMQQPASSDNHAQENDIPFPSGTNSVVLEKKRASQPRKIILTAGIAVLLILITSAYIFQSPRFPETAFEASLLWAGVALLYTIILFRIWK